MATPARTPMTILASMRAPKRRKRSRSTFESMRSVSDQKSSSVGPARSLFYTKTAFPTKMTRTLRYMESELTLTTGAGGSLGFDTFSANGMYDPYTAAGGHQPIGFDQIMAAYDHYRVREATIHVWFRNVSNILPVWVGVFVNDIAAPAATTVINTIENGKGSWAFLAKDNDSKAYTKLSLKVDLDKFFGERSTAYDKLLGDKSSNPSDQASFIVWAGDNGGSGPVQVKANCILEYKAEFTEPVQLGQS